MAESARYKLEGSRTPGEKTDVVILQGTSSAPEHFMQLGGDSVELSEDEYQRLNKRYKLRKVNEENGSQDSVDDSGGNASDSTEQQVEEKQ